jgi:hypothetical protein
MSNSEEEQKQARHNEQVKIKIKNIRRSENGDGSPPGKGTSYYRVAKKEKENWMRPSQLRREQLRRERLPCPCW